MRSVTTDEVKQAAERAYWAVLGRGRVGDTASGPRHLEAIEAYIATIGTEYAAALALETMIGRVMLLRATLAEAADKLALAGLEKSSKRARKVLNEIEAVML